MSAYVIVDVNVTDARKYDAYKELAPAIIAAHGGRFLVRGGETSVLEGDWSPQRVVVLEFPTMADAQAFHASAEYQHAITVRAGGATLKMVAVRGA